MIFPWEKSPVIKVMTPVLAGTIPCVYFGGDYWKSGYVLAGIILIIFFNGIFSRRKLIFGRLCFIGILLLAGINVYLTDGRNRADNYTRCIGKVKFFLAKVDSEPEEKSRSVAITCKIITGKTSTGWETYSGKALLYLEKEPEVFDLKQGSLLIFKNNLDTQKAPVFPGLFDFGSYLETKQVYSTGYITHEHWKLLPSKEGIFLGVKGYLRKSINDLFENQEARNLGMALLLGEKGSLSQNTRQIFASTGSMHVLAVSGLHVGLIYSVIFFFLKYLGNSLVARVSRWMLLLLVVWGYALLTGMSPSVVRASSMMTFILVGQLSGHRSSLLSSLFAAAFFMILVNPAFIKMAGFQLSFGALGGILLFQRRFEKGLKFIRAGYLSGLLSVSIAAQLGTFPLAIYYFHQFPLIFFISNFWVIPLATIILYGGLGGILVGGLFPSLVYFIRKGLTFLVDLFISGVEVLSEIPYSVINDLFFTEFECILAYLMIGIFFSERFKKVGMLPILFSCLMLITLISSITRKVNSERSGIFGAIYGKELIAWRGGGEGVLFTFNEENASRPLAIPLNFFLEYGLNPEHIQRVDLGDTGAYCGNTWYFKYPVLILDTTTIYLEPRDNFPDLPPDYLFLKNRDQWNPDKMGGGKIIINEKKLPGGKPDTLPRYNLNNQKAIRF